MLTFALLSISAKLSQQLGGDERLLPHSLLYRSVTASSQA